MNRLIIALIEAPAKVRASQALTEEIEDDLEWLVFALRRHLEETPVPPDVLAKMNQALMELGPLGLGEQKPFG